MPQPYRPSDLLAIDPEAPKRRPDLAIRLACIATRSSYLEYLIGVMLTELLGTAQEIGAAMYLSLSGSAAQKAVLDAVVSKRLTENGQKQFAELQKVIKTAQKQRNDVIHGAWTVVSDRPNALLLFSTRAAIESAAKSYELEGQSITDATFHQALIDTQPPYSAYEESDLIKIEDDITTACMAVIHFVSRLGELSLPLAPAPRTEEAVPPNRGKNDPVAES